MTSCHTETTEQNKKRAKHKMKNNKFRNNLCKRLFLNNVHDCIQLKAFGLQ